MVYGFHSFSDGQAIESGGQSQDAFQNAEVLGIVEHIAHKATVDFQGVDGEALEVSERRVTGAEIVERDGDADLTARREHMRDLGHIVQRAGLEHFQFQPGGKNIRVSGENSPQAIAKIGLLEVMGGDVDADGNVQTGHAPFLQLGQRMFDHPFADAVDEGMVLDDGKKQTGQQASARGMVPADEGLRARGWDRKSDNDSCRRAWTGTWPVRPGGEAGRHRSARFGDRKPRRCWLRPGLPFRRRIRAAQRRRGGFRGWALRHRRRADRAVRRRTRRHRYG